MRDLAVASAPASGRDGRYQIPFKVQGRIVWALLDSGSMQTMIHHSLFQPTAVDEHARVIVRCIHGDVHDYPSMTLEIDYKKEKHSVKAAVSSRLTCPLLIGTDWPGFWKTVTVLGEARSRQPVTCGTGAALAGDARSPVAVPGGGTRRSLL